MLSSAPANGRPELRCSRVAGRPELGAGCWYSCSTNVIRKRPSGARCSTSGAEEEEGEDEGEDEDEEKVEAELEEGERKKQRRRRSRRRRGGSR